MPRKIEISHRTIIFTVFFLAGFWVLFQIRQIILGIFVAIIIMSALNPLVDRIERRFFPRILAILLVYFLIFGAFGLIIASVIPPLVDQTAVLINQVPFYIRKVGILGVDPNLIVSQMPNLAEIPANILRFSLDIFSNLVSGLVVLVIAFYLLLERKKLNQHLVVLFGDDQEKRAEDFINKVETRLGRWVRGEIILMTIVGLLAYFGLRLLGIEIALPLAILAGVLEIVPNIGPIIASVPAIIAGLAISPPIGLAVAAWYFVLQQFENTLIAPKIMEKTVGINPLMTILALAIGVKLGGAVGLILAIPIVLLFQVITSEVFTSKRFQNL